jgi:hypothetical protein
MKHDLKCLIVCALGEFNGLMRKVQMLVLLTVHYCCSSRLLKCLFMGQLMLHVETAGEPYAWSVASRSEAACQDAWSS